MFTLFGHFGYYSIIFQIIAKRWLKVCKMLFFFARFSSTLCACLYSILEYIYNIFLNKTYTYLKNGKNIALIPERVLLLFLQWHSYRQWFQIPFLLKHSVLSKKASCLLFSIQNWLVLLHDPIVTSFSAYVTFYHVM